MACEAEQMDTTPAAEEETVQVTFESENAIEDASNVEEKTNGNDQGEVKGQQNCNAYLPGVYSLRSKWGGTYLLIYPLKTLVFVA